MARVEITSEVIGNVWKIVSSPGDQVSENDTLLIVESMKMEIPIEAGYNGKLVALLVKEEDPVEEDQVVAILETS